jgi:hypothetical protein
MIEGAVARDIGNHAFVPHESAGTTWLDCISYETWDDAYWWDAGDQSVDTVFDRCVAVNVWPHEANKYTTGGFRLGLGPADTNVVRNCVAANVAGFGFLWYDGSEGDWVANDCVAHNVIGSGLWVWQNNNIDQVISDFICYNNDVYGIDHGAYGNGYVYEGGAFVGNAAGPVAISAVANHNSTGGGLRFSGLYCDASGADFGIIVPDGAPVEASLPTIIENCRIVNASQACIFWHGSGADAWAEVRDCEFEGNEILLDDEVGSNTRIELFDARLGNLLVTRGDQAGEAVPEWNAVVQAI